MSHSEADAGRRLPSLTLISDIAMYSLTSLPRETLLIVAGPTGAGKSELALKLALEFGGEVVNADSVQLYRGLDIGTAKLAPEEWRGVPHHLIDVLEPEQVFSSGDWAEVAATCIREITGRGAVPVVAGGTGFYIRTLVEGISLSPKRDEDIRRRLAEREQARPGAIARMLRRLDPATAARIHPNDSHKLVRALEICLLKRGPASSHFAAAPVRRLEGYFPVWLVLDPPRAELHERIARRTRRMFEAGLLEEVERLLARGVPSSAKAFESIGYRECLSVLAGLMTEAEAMERVTIATRQYAKRQTTWFRRESNCLRIEHFGDSREALDTAVQYVVDKFHR
jgi:tRNA dimethylallyltransferase